MTRLTKEIKQEIKQYCLNAITSDVVFKNDSEKVLYCWNRFKSEYGHEIKRFGLQKAFSNWLSGLALDIAFYNFDILELAKKWGQDTTTEKQQDKILSQYWDFMTNQYFKLFKEFKINIYEVF